MNVWAIKKDLSIKHFLIELVHQFGENTFSLNETITHDQAIEIYLSGQADIRAYIFTFSQQAGRYGIDLFFPIDQHRIVGENEELTLDALLSIIQTHFNLI